MWTIFPASLAEASSWDPDLAYRTARASAVESTASGIMWTFSPMVDTARDQRWGRDLMEFGRCSFDLMGRAGWAFWGFWDVVEVKKNLRTLNFPCVELMKAHRWRKRILRLLNFIYVRYAIWNNVQKCIETSCNCHVSCSCHGQTNIPQTPHFGRLDFRRAPVVRKSGGSRWRSLPGRSLCTSKSPGFSGRRLESTRDLGFSRGGSSSSSSSCCCRLSAFFFWNRWAAVLKACSCHVCVIFFRVSQPPDSLASCLKHFAGYGGVLAQHLVTGLPGIHVEFLHTSLQGSRITRQTQLAIISSAALFFSSASSSNDPNKKTSEGSDVPLRPRCFGRAGL